MDGLVGRLVDGVVGGLVDGGIGGLVEGVVRGVVDGVIGALPVGCVTVPLLIEVVVRLFEGAVAHSVWLSFIL